MMISAVCVRMELDVFSNVALSLMVLSGLVLWYTATYVAFGTPVVVLELCHVHSASYPPSVALISVPFESTHAKRHDEDVDERSTWILASM